MVKLIQKFCLYLSSLFFCLMVFQGQGQDLLSYGKAFQTDEKQREQEKSLEQTLWRISKKFDVKFAYEEKLIGNRFLTGYQVLGNDLNEVLTSILKPFQLKHKKVESDYYVIQEDKRTRESVKKIHSKPLQEASNKNFQTPFLYPLSLSDKARFTIEKTVKGRVTSDEKETLPGVNVLVKGSTIGTITDVDGNYQINVPNENTILVFSYVGYVSEEVGVGDRSVIDVVLLPDISTLSEIVVVGYGKQERANVTGSIASIKSDQIKELPVSSFDQALAGQAAGVQVSQVSGAPGGAVAIRVRGTGSISAANEPLYVIDGFPISNNKGPAGTADDLPQNSLNSINPKDIESIEILKDASAAAIYGSRGANGVVIITTKRGQSGKAKLSFGASYGVQEVANRIEMMNAAEYAEFFNEAHNNAWVDFGSYTSAYTGDPNKPREASDPNEWRNSANFQIPTEFQNPAALGAGTDWQDEIFRKAYMQNYQLSASGGTEQTQYYVSGSYFKQDGTIIGSGYERFAGQVNVDSKFSDKLKLSVSLTPSHSISNLVKTEGPQGSGAVINSALTISPHIPVKDANGEFADQIGFGFGTGNYQNPVLLAEAYENLLKQTRLLSNINLSYEIIEGLTVKVLAGTDLIFFRSDEFIPSNISLNGSGFNTRARAENRSSVNWLNENTLTYQKVFNQDHDLTVLLGYTTQKARSETTLIQASDFPNELVKTLNQGIVNDGRTTASEWTLISQLARINYTYQNKYLLTGAIRRDGSSRFGANNRFGLFPSLSLGWRVSEEAFLGNVSWIDDLKLRGSFGRSGNNAIGNYAHIAAISEANYIFNGGIANGLAPSSSPNADLNWERTQMLNVALDVSILEGRVFLTSEFYKKNTDDLLLAVQVPQLSGFGSSTTNIGEVENKGMEFTVSSRNLVGELSWETNFNISFNRNKVLALGPEGDDIISNGGVGGTHITSLGKPLGSFYGLEVIGIFNSQAEVDSEPSVDAGRTSRPGDFKFRDANGDGVITTDDRVIIGNPHPDFTWGITNTLKYKAFDLNILFQGVQGNDVLQLSKRLFANFAANANLMSEQLERWRSPENPGNGKIPRANRLPSGRNTNISTHHLVDGSFVRLRNLAIGYTLPVRIASAWGISGARVYISGQNLFTITNYTGYNPEVNTNGEASLVPGTDYGSYPISRIYTLGVNLEF